MSNNQTTLFETTKSNNTVSVSQIPQQRENPIAEMAETMMQGNVPNNQQIEKTLNTTSVVLENQRPQLSAQGNVLASDTQQVIDATKRLMLEKNDDELLQGVLLQSKEAAKENIGVVNAQLNQPGVQTTVSDMYGYVRTLAVEMLRSGELRTMSSEVLQLMLLMFGSKADNRTGLPTNTPYIPLITPPINTSNFPSTTSTVYTPSAFPNSMQSPSAFPTMGPSPVMSTGQYIDPIQKAAAIEAKRNKLVDTMLSLLTRIGRREELRTAFLNMFQLVDVLTDRNLWVQDQNTTLQTQNATGAIRDARRLLERFTGKEALDRFRNDLWSLYNDISEDQFILQYFTDLKRFVLLSLQDPEGLQNPQRRATARFLVDRGRLLTKQEGYRYRFRDLVDEAQVLLTNIQRDSATQDFQNAIQNLVLDTVGRQGDQFQPSLLTMNESLQQLKLILLPVMKEYLNNLPIDRIDIKTPKYDACIENLLISGVDILPDFLHFKLKNKFDVDSSNLAFQSFTSKLSLKLDHIAPNMKGVKFWYQRKSIPRIEDYGVADVAFDREGAKIRIIWKLVSKSGSPTVVELSHVRCTIDRINVKIIGSETKHNILDKVMLTFLKGTIKKRICEAVETYVRNNVEKLNGLLNQFFQSRPLDRALQKGDELLQQQQQQRKLQETSL